MAILIVASSATIVTVLFGLSALQNYRFYARYGAPLVPADVDPGAIRTRLEESSQQIDQALGDARQAVVSLQDAVEEQRRELEEVRSRYDSLKVLADGQEEIAAAHRRILEDVGLLRRLADIVLGLFLGIVASLGANAIWKTWHRREPAKLEQLRSEVRAEVIAEVEEEERQYGMEQEALDAQALDLFDE
jgi:hypothetical protein